MHFDLWYFQLTVDLLEYNPSYVEEHLYKLLELKSEMKFIYSGLACSRKSNIHGCYWITSLLEGKLNLSTIILVYMTITFVISQLCSTFHLFIFFYFWWQKTLPFSCTLGMLIRKCRNVPFLFLNTYFCFTTRSPVLYTQDQYDFCVKALLHL